MGREENGLVVEQCERAAFRWDLSHVDAFLENAEASRGGGKGERDCASGWERMLEVSTATRAHSKPDFLARQRPDEALENLHHRPAVLATKAVQRDQGLCDTRWSRTSVRRSRTRVLATEREEGPLQGRERKSRTK